jgi:hypothetical protein
MPYPFLALFLADFSGIVLAEESKMLGSHRFGDDGAEYGGNVLSAGFCWGWGKGTWHLRHFGMW